jgi:hypothetical protein
MPNQVHDVLLHTLSGTELSRVRTELHRRRILAGRFATSSTGELPVGVLKPPWRCSCADAWLDGCSDDSSRDSCVPPPGRPPPARTATTNDPADVSQPLLATAVRGTGRANRQAQREQLAEQGKTFDRGTALPRSTSRRVPLVLVFRCDSSPRPLKQPNIRPMGGQVPAIYGPLKATIRISEAGDTCYRRSIFKAVYSRSRSVTSRRNRGSSRKLSRCGSTRKKAQHGNPVSALRSSQAKALSVSRSTA